MKIFLPESLNINIRRFLQQKGYASHFQSKNDRLSFVKRITSDDYPRFHIYIEKDLHGKQHLTLHLDQKKPSYLGSRAHMGEYSGDLVQSEARELQKHIFENHQYVKNNDRTPTQKKGFLAKIFHN